MIKKEIYPKTKRVSCVGEPTEITEKIDGSNLCIFRLEDKLYFAQRSTILCEDEIEEHKDVLYKGLYQWIKDNKDNLASLRNNAVVCGEWLGMGKLKYMVEQGFDKRFYMFAKANIHTDNFQLYNLHYYHNLFIYPFEDLTIPECIGVVPVAYSLTYVPKKEELDELYSKYVEQVGRNVEGFVVNYNDDIRKYVRMKNGTLSEHFDRGE